MKAPRSLKARALQWLAQREHSRSELRRKLLAAIRADARAQVSASDKTSDRTDPTDSGTGPLAVAAAVEQVDALLDWLEAHRYLSTERFIESRVHAREARYGNLRIRQELKQHQVELSTEAALALRESELQRACAVLERKFGTMPPACLAERARRMRFLTGRGFSVETIQAALRRNGAEQHATFSG